MKIAIDIDDVLMEFSKGFLIHGNKKFGKNIDFEGLFEYSLMQVLGISRKEELILLDEFYETKEFYETSPFEGAQNALNFLSKNNEIYIITARSLKIKSKTDDFFSKHFPNLNYKIFHSGDFSKEQGKTKAELCKELQIDILVEDNKSFCESCAKTGVNVFLVDKPWNQNHKKHEKISRCKDWQEIFEKIQKIKLQKEPKKILEVKNEF